MSSLAPSTELREVPRCEGAQKGGKEREESGIVRKFEILLRYENGSP